MLQKLIIDKEIEKTISDLKRQQKKLSSRNQSPERKKAISLTNSFIANIRKGTNNWDKYLKTYFKQNPNNNLYYLREEYLKMLVITKMVIEDSNSITLKELEIDL